MSIFNPKKWAVQEINEIGEEGLQKLDNRYINTGENVLDQNITNLNLVHLNIASSGTIYFNSDNTTQTTAYDPNLVTSRINNLLTGNNNWTGQNAFTQLVIKDPLSTKTSQIVENDSNLTIENNNTAGSIIITTRNSGGAGNITIDQFRNVAGINDVNCSKLIGNEVRINSNSYLIRNNGNDDLGITNNIVNRGIKLITKGSSSVSELLFDSSGNLYIPSNVITNLLKTESVEIAGAITMSRLNSNFTIDNNILSSSFKIKNYDASGNAKTLTIDSNLNMFGVNDMKPNRLVFPYTILSNPTIADFLIEHYPRGGNIIIRNYDDNGFVKELQIQKNMNVTGINDLYVQRVFLNNVLLDFTKYDEMLTNTRLIKSSTSSQTSIEYSTGRFLFLPLARSQESSRNGIIKANDNVLLAYDAASMTGNNVLTLCPWTSSTNLVGIRATPVQTELYKPTVMDSLKFGDNTVQTTAMTDAYLEAKIASVINSLNLTMLVPVGTILAFGGNPSTPPTGYLGCLGQYVSISTYQNLFNVIGHNFVKGHTTNLPSGSFWLPDLGGAYLKGVGASEIWGPLPNIGNNYVGQDPMFYVGDIQRYNVGKHRHMYTDRGVDSKLVGGGSTVNAIKGSNGSYFTEVDTYDVNNNLLNEENRPNSVGVSYIIKF